MAGPIRSKKTARRPAAARTSAAGARARAGAGRAARAKAAARKAKARTGDESVGARARRLAASAAERLSPALERAVESAGEAITALKKTAVSAGRAVERSGVASRPISRARSLIAESLHRLEPKIRPLRLLLLDVDGVLTDGNLWYIDSGEEMKRFHIHDGMGVDLLQRAGIQVGVLTGRRSDVVERRCRELGMRVVKQGYYDKSAAFEEVLREEGLEAEEVGYVGDDVQDLSVLRRAGFAAAPANAVAEVQAEADYVTSRRGGQGAVRDVADLIITALGRKDEVIAAASAPGTSPPPGRPGTMTV